MTDGIEFKENDPVSQSAFEAAVENIKNGNAARLPSLDPDRSFKELRDLDASLLVPLIKRAGIFLNDVIYISGQHEISEKEKLKEISKRYKTNIDFTDASDIITTPITLQTLSLGALVFAGKTEKQQNVLDLNTVNLKQLNEREQEVISGIAAGIKLGYKDQADEKFGSLVKNIQALTINKIQSSDQIGDDFVEALLITRL